jgi:uncharacterized protein YjiS (DUF1127 family)
MQSAEPKVLDGLAAPRDLAPLARSHEPPLPVVAEHALHVSNEVLADIDRRMEAALHFAARPDARGGASHTRSEAGYPTRTHWSRILYCDLLGVELGGDNWSRSGSITGRIRKTIVAGIEKAAAFTRRLRARRRQQREAWTAYDALRQLDDHTLRDLGFERSELKLVVSEEVIFHATVRQLEGSL